MAPYKHTDILSLPIELIIYILYNFSIMRYLFGALFSMAYMVLVLLVLYKILAL